MADPSLETDVEFAGDENIETHSGDGHMAPCNVASLFKESKRPRSSLSFIELECDKAGADKPPPFVVYFYLVSLQC